MRSLKSIIESLKKKQTLMYVLDWLHRALCREDRKNRR